MGRAIRTHLIDRLIEPYERPRTVVLRCVTLCYCVMGITWDRIDFLRFFLGRMY